MGANSSEVLQRILSSSLHGHDDGLLSEKDITNIIFWFHKILTFVKSFTSSPKESSASLLCHACPDVTSRHPDDRQVVASDGNFRHKGDYGRDENDLSLPGYNDLWLVEDDTKPFEGVKPPSCSSLGDDDSKLNAIINQEKSAQYPVSGYFGMCCVRHDFSLKMIEMNKGEKFKYPLGMLKSLDVEERATKVLVMYDVGCKLHKPAK
ncbi:unnamed protein product [Mucor hiemalis]